MIQVLYVCSSNSGKLREFLLAAKGSPFDVQMLPGLKDITPPEETAASFEANAALKAIYYSRLTDELVLADDSGLEVDALAGEPGIFSARYAGTNATDAENNSLLLKNLGRRKERTARFVSVVALAKQSQVLVSACGTVEGEILAASRGTGGFGYDPIFFYPPCGCSFGEIDDDRKLAVSARGKAFRSALEQMSRFYAC